MNNKLKTVYVKDIVDEAAFWFMDGPPGREVATDYTESYYWGLEDEEKKAISYTEFHFAVQDKVKNIVQAVNNYKRSFG